MTFTDFLKSDNINLAVVPKKERYFYAILNLKNNFTGRSSFLELNSFISESAQQLVNSIIVFEMGYFDCAYFSMRSAIEILIIALYFIDTTKTDDEMEKEIVRWRKRGWFPVNSKIFKKLENEGRLYNEIQVCIPELMNEIKNDLNKLNKIVHKQGFDYFYVNRKFKDNDFILSKVNEFEANIFKAIRHVGILRLMIDPIPLLLSDKEICQRVPWILLGEEYNEDFLEEYIGAELIEKIGRAHV